MRNNKVAINKYILSVSAILFLGIGLLGGYLYTKNHYERKEMEEFSKEKENLICQVRLQNGKIGDVKSDYFIFEQSAREEDCLKYIEYKNIPEDTETYWLGF